MLYITEGVCFLISEIKVAWKSNFIGHQVPLGTFWGVNRKKKPRAIQICFKKIKLEMSKMCE